MRNAAIASSILNTPPVAKVEDFFDMGWDMARSTLWQNTGKTTPCDDNGEDIIVIEPIVGTEDLVYDGNVSNVPVKVAGNFCDFLTSRGTNQRYATAAFTLISQVFEIWMVVENLAGQDFGGWIAYPGAATFTDRGTGFRTAVGVNAEFAGAGPADGVVQLMRAVFNGSSSQLYIDGTQVGGDQDAGSNGITRVALGTNSTQADWRLYEMWVKDGAMGGDAATVTDLLKTEYGIS